MRGIALAAIRGYQRWISPHKGYCCALRAVTGGDSCSAYGYQVIERFGLRRGLGLLDRRLALCSHVHRSVAAAVPASAPATPVRNPWRHKEQGHCDVPGDAPGCDSPGCDLPCHGGRAGRACSLGGDLLDLASCGCDIWDCGHSNRGRSRRCRDRCGPGRARHRDSVDLDVLARRIEERRRQRSS